MNNGYHGDIWKFFHDSPDDSFTPLSVYLVFTRIGIPLIFSFGLFFGKYKIVGNFFIWFMEHLILFVIFGAPLIAVLESSVNEHIKNGRQK